MKRTTSRAEARAALLKAQAAAAEARKRREIANVGDLTTFVVETAKLDGVDAWERERLEKVRADAEARRRKHRVNAGRALQAMRRRGETIASIAAQAGMSTAVVRGFLQAAANDAPAGAVAGGVDRDGVAAAATASEGGAGVPGHDRSGSAPSAG